MTGPKTGGNVVFDHVRRDDGEHVGYIALTDDGLFVPFDLLRVRRGEPMELDEAEAVLDAIGLRMLAEEWELQTDRGPIRVGILECTRDAVRVAPLLMQSSGAVAKTLDPHGAITLPIPAPTLRPLRAPDGPAAPNGNAPSPL